MPTIIRKSEFARLINVSPNRVSGYIREGKISGAALVGTGYRSRINVEIALEQLQRNLDPSQVLGARGRARLDIPFTTASPLAPVSMEAAGAAPTVEAEIKGARLQQIALSNQRAQEEAALRNGRYVLAADARQSAGRIAARMVTMFDGAITEFASVIAARSNIPAQDVLGSLRSAWRGIRERAAKSSAEEAAALPALLDEAP